MGDKDIFFANSLQIHDVRCCCDLSSLPRVVVMSSCKGNIFQYDQEERLGPLLQCCEQLEEQI